MHFHGTYQSPLGTIALVSTESSLTACWFEGQKYSQGLMPKDAALSDSHPILAEGKSWLDDYFAGRNPAAGSLPLAPEGSAFRQLVWKILMSIPYGQVTTYAEIAREVSLQQGVPMMSPQAVGGAVGHNPISVIIPCHRVVGANGSLTGYAGGINRKRHLLEHEGLDLTRFSIPKIGSAL